MATINIVRRKEYNDRGRSYSIMLDGKYAGTIASGQSVNINTSPGLHTVSVKIDWCSSPDIVLNVQEDKIESLVAGGFKNANWLMPIATLLLAIHFILKIFFNFQYLIYLVIPFFLVLMYYLTLGRKKYLTLKEI